MFLDGVSDLAAEGFWAILKLGFLLLFLLYFIYSLVVVRQVYLMTKTVITDVSPVLKILGIFHAVAAFSAVVIFLWLVLAG